MLRLILFALVLSVLIGIFLLYGLLTNSSGIIYGVGAIAGFAVSEFLNYKNKKNNNEF